MIQINIQDSKRKYKFILLFDMGQNITNKHSKNNKRGKMNMNHIPTPPLIYPFIRFYFTSPQIRNVPFDMSSKYLLHHASIEPLRSIGEE